MRTVELKVAESAADVQAGGYAECLRVNHSIPITGLGGAVIDHQFTGGTLIASSFPALVEYLGRCVKRFTGQDSGAQSTVTFGCHGGHPEPVMVRPQPPQDISLESFLKDATGEQLAAMRIKINEELYDRERRK